MVRHYALPLQLWRDNTIKSVAASSSPMASGPESKRRIQSLSIDLAHSRLLQPFPLPQWEHRVVRGI